MHSLFILSNNKRDEARGELQINLCDSKKGIPRRGAKRKWLLSGPTLDLSFNSLFMVNFWSYQGGDQGDGGDTLEENGEVDFLPHEYIKYFN